MNSEDRSVFDLPYRHCDSVEKYGLDPDQIIEVFDPASTAFGQVVLIHGGYWRPEFDCAHLRSYAGALADLGWRVQLIEYRRVPGFPNKSVEDIRAAIVHCGGGVLIGHFELIDYRKPPLEIVIEELKKLYFPPA